MPDIYIYIPVAYDPEMEIVRKKIKAWVWLYFSVLRVSEEKKKKRKL